MYISAVTRESIGAAKEQITAVMRLRHHLMPESARNDLLEPRLHRDRRPGERDQPGSSTMLLSSGVDLSRCSSAASNIMYQHD
jgi:hypothetical protein